MRKYVIVNNEKRTKVKGEVDLIRVLHALIHGLGLPPSRVIVVLKISQVGGRVITLVAVVARFTFNPGLFAIFNRDSVFAAGIRCLYRNAECGIQKGRNAFLKH